MWKWLLLVLLLCGGTQIAAASGDGSARPRTRPSTAPATEPKEKTQADWDAFFDFTARGLIIVVLIGAAIFLVFRKFKRFQE